MKADVTVISIQSELPLANRLHEHLCPRCFDHEACNMGCHQHHRPEQGHPCLCSRCEKIVARLARLARLARRERGK